VPTVGTPADYEAAAGDRIGSFHDDRRRRPRIGRGFGPGRSRRRRSSRYVFLVRNHLTFLVRAARNLPLDSIAVFIHEVFDIRRSWKRHGSPSPIAAGHGAWGRRRDQLGQPAVLRRPQSPAIHFAALLPGHSGGRSARACQREDCVLKVCQRAPQGERISSR
jgi:hypothetical protein